MEKVIGQIKKGILASVDTSYPAKQIADAFNVKLNLTPAEIIENWNNLNQNKMEQTAVEFIKTKVEENSDTSFLNIDWDKFDEIIEQAKEIEKKQMFEYIKKHYVIGENSLKFHQEQFEQYYNETFKK